MARKRRGRCPPVYEERIVELVRGPWHARRLEVAVRDCGGRMAEGVP